MSTENNISKKIFDIRPTFFIDKNPIRASGILFYVYDKVKKKKLWLLRREIKQSTFYYCDTGGKTDSVDKSPIDTAIRETIEETNGHLFSKKHSKKKCFTTLKKLIKTDWWTRDTLTLNESGQIKLNGFYGEYNIQIQNNNKILKGDFEIKKGETSSIKIELK